MSEKNIERKEQLFNLYASNLSLYMPELKDIFMCPLCGERFPRTSIHSNDVTIEHIIPQGIGGRLTTLTCKSCNNTDGSSLDSHLVQKLRHDDILAGKSELPLRATIKIGEGELGADVYLSEDKNPNIRIIGLPQISNPELHKRAQEDFSQGAREIQMTGNLGYSPKRSTIAIIRSAYLMMFRYFGYGYILFDNVRKVVEQIANPDIETNILKSVMNLKDAPPYNNSVAVLLEPRELRSFLVLLDLSTKITRNIAVALPGLDAKSDQIIDRWASLTDSGDITNTKPRFQTLQYSPTIPSDPTYKFLPSGIWSVVYPDEPKDKVKSK